MKLVLTFLASGVFSVVEVVEVLLMAGSPGVVITTPCCFIGNPASESAHEPSITSKRSRILTHLVSLLEAPYETAPKSAVTTRNLCVVIVVVGILLLLLLSLCLCLGLSWDLQ